jgi:hypothetical protein
VDALRKVAHPLFGVVGFCLKQSVVNDGKATGGLFKKSFDGNFVLQHGLAAQNGRFPALKDTDSAERTLTKSRHLLITLIGILNGVPSRKGSAFFARS